VLALNEHNMIVDVNIENTLRRARFFFVAIYVQKAAMFGGCSQSMKARPHGPIRSNTHRERCTQCTAASTGGADAARGRSGLAAIVGTARASFKPSFISSAAPPIEGAAGSEVAQMA